MKREERREGFGAKHLASFAALAGIGMRRQTGGSVKYFV